MALGIVQSAIVYAAAMHGSQSPAFTPTTMTATFPADITPGNHLVFFVSKGNGAATILGDLTSFDVEGIPYDPAAAYDFEATTNPHDYEAKGFLPTEPFPDIPGCRNVTYTAPAVDTPTPITGYEMRMIIVEVSGWTGGLRIDTSSSAVFAGSESAGVYAQLIPAATADGIMIGFCSAVGGPFSSSTSYSFDPAPVSPFTALQFDNNGIDQTLNFALAAYAPTLAGHLYEFSFIPASNHAMNWVAGGQASYNWLYIGMNLILGHAPPPPPPPPVSIPPPFYYPGPYQSPRSSPFNLQTLRGSMFRVAMKAGDALMWQSDRPDPAKGWRVNGAAVTELGDVAHARIAFDSKGLLRVIFDHAGNVYEAVSADGGKTYAADALIFPAAKYADITASAGKLSGTILIRSAYAPATKQLGIVEQWGGGTISDEWNPMFLGPFGTEPMQVEDDTFRISGRNGIFRSWYLHVRILGEGHTSGWVSTDYCRTWSRLDGISIVGGTHPTVMAGPRLSEMVWSAYNPSDNTIQGIRHFAGAKESFTFQKSAGNLLGSDGGFHFEQAREPMARYIMSLVASGESDVSEWWSKDYAGSWTRI